MEDRIKKKGKKLKQKLEKRFDENVELEYVTKDDFIEQIRSQSSRTAKMVERRYSDLDGDDVVMIQRADGGEIPRDIKQEVSKELADDIVDDRYVANNDEVVDDDISDSDTTPAFVDLSDGDNFKEAQMPVSMLSIHDSVQTREGLQMVQNAAKVMSSETDLLPMPGRRGGSSNQQYFRSLERAKRIAKTSDDKIVVPVMPSDYVSERTGQIEAWTLTDDVN